MSLEDKIRALLESKKEAAKDAETKPAADDVDKEPAVKIENPMDPNLSSSDVAEKTDEPSEKVEESVGDESLSIDSLLTEEFSDEFKLKAQVIFQAAVKAQVTALEESLKAEYAQKATELETKFYEQLEEKTKLIEEKTSDKIDDYLTYVAEEWRKENALAIESGIRTELTEQFIDGLKGLFESSYIDLPEERVDLYKQALQEKQEAETALMTSISTARRLEEELSEMKRAQIIEESIKDFSALDATKLKSLVEDFEYDSEESFRKKVDILTKSFFGRTKPTETREQLSESFVNTTPIVDSQEIVESVEDKTDDPVMSAYLKALR